MAREERLRPGDRVGLGSDFRMTFDLPSERSASARLTLSPGFDVEGVQRVLLMRADGPDGRIVLANSDRAHVTVPELRQEVEIYRAVDGSHEGEFVCRSLSGVQVDGQGGRAEERLFPGCFVRAGDVRFSIQSV